MSVNIEKAKKYLADVQDTHQARAGERGGKYGLVHEDGTPCNAETIESCPHEKKAVQADELEPDAEGQESNQEEEPSREQEAEERAKQQLENIADWMVFGLDDALESMKEHEDYVFDRVDTSWVSDKQSEMAKQAKDLQDDYWDLMSKMRELMDRARQLRA